MRKEQEWPSGLYIVGTPIGNLDDLSSRALEALRRADLLVAEDTRVAKKLHESLQDRGWISFHEDSGRGSLENVEQALVAKQKVAFVSDAGTPGISDPGYQLVRLADQLGCRVIPIPGPSSVAVLLSVSGWDCSDYHFLGYAPRSGQVAWFKKMLFNGAGVHVWFEAPHRILQCLRSLQETGLNGELVVGRELTKRFETVVRGDLVGVVARILNEEPRGEYVLAYKAAERLHQTQAINAQSVDPWPLLEELARDGLPQKSLVKIGRHFGIERAKLYRRLLEIKQNE